MKKLTLLIVVIALLAACTKDNNYDPNAHLTPTQKDAIITTIVRYAAGSPDAVNNIEKFKPEYDSFYMVKQSKIRFERFFPEDDYFYFLISQPAPSLYEKRHATGGRFKLNDKGELTEYEEIFRTWKMVPDTLQRRSYMLFDKMVKQEDLQQYYTKNSGGVDYIEFPDDRTYYDKQTRSWKAR
ncbi:hypothetical protein KK083_17320 [Fulvivirgaceae bacterium PWU4]|uniref:DUF4296 domain-containing protein n=1 Tax=Chryseosolibacter histidini TaxID=2782349 RepID=A0AAP2DP51_9BACT|nr:hypothetical protein [Chryseosolibacter histidini]MBT1698657.1 hypothetical protein [Chryseosolibacter histidini]